MGLTDYGTAAAAFFFAFLLIYCIAFFVSYTCDKRINCNSQMSEEAKPAEEDMTDDEAKRARQKIEAQEQEDDEIAVKQIGDDSVYSFFVTEKGTELPENTVKEIKFNEEKISYEILIIPIIVVIGIIIFLKKRQSH